MITYAIQIFEIFDSTESERHILSFDVNYDEILFVCKLQNDLSAEEKRVLNDPQRLLGWRKIMAIFGKIDC